MTIGRPLPISPIRPPSCRGGFRAVVLACAAVVVGGVPVLAQTSQSVPFDPKGAPGPFADFAPLGGNETPEGKALAALVKHARQFTTEQLAEKAVEVSLADLLAKNSTVPNVLAKPELRLQLVKFNARLNRIVRSEPSPELKAEGIKDLFEVRLTVGDGDTFLYFVASQLPSGVTVGTPPESRVQVCGYFLKPVRYRVADALVDGAGGYVAPLLVGHSFTVAAKSKYEFDGDRQVFKGIRDFISLKDGNRVAEGTAYEELVAHARKFDARELAAAAEEAPMGELLRRKLVTVPGAFPGQPAEQQLKMEREDLRFRLLKVTGQLKQVIRQPVPADLAAAGVTDLYEGWLFPHDRNQPVCLLFTELPAGLVPAQEVRPSRTVTAAGYFLKMLRFETSETGKDGKPVVRYAPLLIGRMPVDTEKPDADGGQNWRTVFLPAILTGLGLLTVLFLGLTWWFKSSDRKSKQAVEAKRVNPFDPPTGDQPPAG